MRGSLAAAIVMAAFAPVAVQAHQERVLYSFAGGQGDGAFTQAGVFVDAQRNLYGTTQAGGGTGCGGSGCGTVFKLTPHGKETVLHIFGQGSDGWLPVGGVTMDTAGNLYGTTFFGGASGRGTIFKVPPKGKETVLFSFSGGDDGSRPVADLILDDAGNLYGTTTGGGSAGNGAVFEFTADGKEKVLYSFLGGTDGFYPAAGLLRDTAGNLFGTTANGGIDCDDSGQGCGTVFKLTPDGTETVLYAFEGGSHGANPAAPVIMDETGALYGTTNNGGMVCDDSGATCGTVFKLAANGKETGLHTFAGGSDGAYPKGGLTMDALGNLYGTTSSGGNGGGECGCGVVFKIRRNGEERIVHTFTGDDGHSPFAGLSTDSSGNFYGTTFVGGAFGDGAVFTLRNR
jgi:uncharacterized repeat protein (TIGR03803 family)